jgi:hypothetical protein
VSRDFIVINQLRILVAVALVGMWQFLPTVAALRSFAPIFDPYYISSPTKVAERLLVLLFTGSDLIWGNGGRADIQQQ